LLLSLSHHFRMGEKLKKGKNPPFCFLVLMGRKKKKKQKKKKKEGRLTAASPPFLPFFPFGGRKPFPPILLKNETGKESVRIRRGGGG